MEQEEQLKDYEMENSQLKTKIKYLEEDNKKYLIMIEQVDDTQNYEEIENFKKKTQLEFEEKLSNEKKELIFKIGELENVIMDKNMQINELRKINENNETEIINKNEQIENYATNYSKTVLLKAKEEEIDELKSKVNKFEQDKILSSIEKKDLEKKLQELKKKSIKEVEDLKTKYEQKLLEQKNKWKSKKETLQKEITNLKSWKITNTSEKSIDPQSMYLYNNYFNLNGIVVSIR